MDYLDAAGCGDIKKATQSVKVIDPRHPLCGRTFDVVSEFRGRGEPQSFEVAYRDGIVLRVLATATEGRYCPDTDIRTKITLAAIRQLLDLRNEWKVLCASKQIPSGDGSRKKTVVRSTRKS